MTDNTNIQTSGSELAKDDASKRVDHAKEKAVKKGWIRLPGVIAFASVVGIAGAGAYFFAEPLLESAIETAGTELNGAKVELDSVSLELFPAKLILNNLTAADADQPMQNLFEFSRAESSIELLKLAMGQVLIPHLALEGLQFGTQRQTSGYVEKKSEGSSGEEKGASTIGGAAEELTEKLTKDLSQEIPSVDDILAREPLLIDQRKKEWDAAYDEQKKIWKDLESKLPNEDKLKSYEKRAKAITKSKIKSLQDFEKQRKALEQLKADIKADKKIVKQAVSQAKTSKKLLQKHIENMKDAPKQDWDRLVNKYSFDQGGLTNLAGLIFGPQMREYTDKALYWYNKIKPHLESKEGDTSSTEQAQVSAEEGRFVRFKEDNPRPDFLIEKADISAILPRGAVAIEAQQITHQQNITGVPTLIHAHSTALEGIKSFDLYAAIDQRSDASKNTIEFTVDELNVDQLRLGSVDQTKLELAKANAGIKGKLNLDNNGELQGAVSSVFNQAKFDGEAPNRFSKELLATLQTIPQFELDADINGTINKPGISVSSDLDKRMKKAFTDRFEEKKKEFKAKMNDKLQEKLAEYLKSSSIELPVDEKDLNIQSGQLDKLLKTKVDDFKEQQKEKIKEKAKKKLEDKFGDKFKGLF